MQSRVLPFRAFLVILVSLLQVTREKFALENAWHARAHTREAEREARLYIEAGR